MIRGSSGSLSHIKSEKEKPAIEEGFFDQEAVSFMPIKKFSDKLMPFIQRHRSSENFPDMGTTAMSVKTMTLSFDVLICLK